jgi:putative peptidoglycan lipid II flippase
VLFPTLSRQIARADMDGFRTTVGSGIRQIAFLLVPASILSAVLAAPIVRLLYQHGAFTSHNTTAVAGALAAFSLGLTFNGTMLMLNRAFFSLQSNWIPTIVALANLGVNAALDAAFYRFGIWGIPLSTSVVNIAGTAALVFLLRRRLGRIGFGEIWSSFVRVLIAGAFAGAAAFAVWKPIDSAAGRGLVGQLGSVIPAFVAAGLVYFAACRVLKVREMQALLSLRGRLRGA